MKTHLWCITTLLISSSSLVHADSFLELSHSNEWTALEEVLIPDPEKINSRNIQTFSELEKAVSKNSHEVMSKMDPIEIALAQQRYETLAGGGVDCGNGTLSAIVKVEESQIIDIYQYRLHLACLNKYHAITGPIIIDTGDNANGSNIAISLETNNYGISPNSNITVLNSCSNSACYNLEELQKDQDFINVLPDLEKKAIQEDLENTINGLKSFF